MIEFIMLLRRFILFDGTIARTVLTMTITGSVLAVMLFLLKLLFRERLPKAAQYYLWLTVVAALLVPVSLLIAVPEKISVPVPAIPIQSMVSQAVMTAQEEININSYSYNVMPYFAQEYPPQTSGKALATSYIIFIYPCSVLIVLSYFIISYIVYTGLYRRRNKYATPMETAMLDELCVGKRAPRLYRNPIAATPMLFGVFRPAIILPDREYTDTQLRAVLLHELTHLRRKDILVKWLTMITCAVHWFNPVVWLVRREIDRACELSCDEAVIRGFDADGRQNYGETLLYVAADSKTPRAILSTTMCEEKKALKERLGAIIKRKKHTRLAIIVSVALIVAAGGTAIAFGAGRTSIYENKQLIIINESAAKIFSVEVYSNGKSHAVSNANNSLIKKGKRVDLQLDAARGSVFQVSVYDADWNLVAQNEFIRYVDDAQLVLYIRDDENGITHIVDESLRLISSLKTPYVGNHSAVSRIISILPTLGGRYEQNYFSIGDDYGTGKSPNTLTLYYERDSEIVGDVTITNQIPLILFALIDNLEEVSIATRNSPSGNGLDESAYGVRYTYPRPEMTDSIPYVGITWGDFLNDWENSFEKLYTQAIMSNALERDNAYDITLDEVRALAAKGDALLMEDFLPYSGTEVGFGLYILHFTVEGGYSLLVGNGGTRGKPMYALLRTPGFEEEIDIRGTDIDEFINRYYDPNEIAGQVDMYLEVIMSSPAISSATGDYINEHRNEYLSILDMGISALPVLTSILESGDKGLRGHIVGMLIQDIVSGEKSKRRYMEPDSFDEYLDSALMTYYIWESGVSSPQIETENIKSIAINPSLTEREAELTRYYSDKAKISRVMDYLNGLTLYGNLPSMPNPKDREIVGYYITINYNDGTVGDYIHFGRFFAVVNGDIKKWRNMTFEESFLFESILNENPSDK
jgi:beta-lactamase regulating signal transducer with metallopeptidase domain